MHCSSSSSSQVCPFLPPLETPFLSLPPLLFSSSPTHPFRSSRYLTLLSSCRISHLILPLLFLYRFFLITPPVASWRRRHPLPTSILYLCLLSHFNLFIDTLVPGVKQKIRSSGLHATFVDFRFSDPHSSGTNGDTCTRETHLLAHDTCAKQLTDLRHA